MRCEEGLPVAEPSPAGWQRTRATTAESAGRIEGLDGVRLEITRAPAEWSLPTKIDKQFMPTFEIQVRLCHRALRE